MGHRVRGAEGGKGAVKGQPEMDLITRLGIRGEGGGGRGGLGYAHPVEGTRLDHHPLRSLTLSPALGTALEQLGATERRI